MCRELRRLAASQDWERTAASVGRIAAFDGLVQCPQRAETVLTPVRGAVPSVASPHDGFEPKMPDAARCTNDCYG